MTTKFRITCSAICLSAILPLHAQIWCPPEAEWHHEYFSAMAQEFGYVVTKYVGDTLVDGRNAQRLERTIFYYSEINQTYTIAGPSVFMPTSVDNNLVEMWNGISFDTLFYFGAPPGYTWQPPGWSGQGTPTITVLDTGHVMKAGAWLRYLTLDLGPYSIVPSGTDTLFERLGLLNIYLDLWTGYESDGNFGGLRCYSDVDINYSRDSLACDFMLEVNDRAGPMPVPRIYPNPGGDRIWVDGFTGTATLQMFDTRGTMLSQSMLGDQGSIHVGDHPAGLYLIRITTMDGYQFQLKWMKE